MRRVFDHPPSGRDPRAVDTLIYELLEAHLDTADLARDLVSDPAWAAHLDYLRALQRVGRETLAWMPAGDMAVER